MTKLKFICLLFLLLLLGQQSQAQKRYPLKGVLIDYSNGMPINNATIYSINSKQSAITDKNGKFSIQISAGDTLKIAHIAFNSKVVPVDNLHGNITIGLDEKNNQLEEVTIHSGYQQLRPNQTTGSYVVINNKQLNQQTGLNILDRLKGVTNGLLYNIGKQNNNPQNKTNITIRGYSTINGPLDPLIVVDNFIYDGDINNINPNDVESITILKDAAAASIWGARAGNGVIVITTKKGHFNEKLEIAFNSNISIQQKPDLYYQPQISSSDYIDYEQFLFSKGYYNSNLSKYNHPAVSPAVLIFQQKKQGLISAADSAKEINALKQTDSRDDFTKYYYRKAITQQYALSLSGGSQNLAWLLSGNYDKSTSNLRAQYNKINLRFENTYKPVKNMTLNVGVYYTNSNSLNGLPDYEDLITLNGNQQVPYLSLAGINGTSIAVPHYYNTSYTDTVGAGKLLDWGYYPLEDYKHSASKINLEELVAHVGLDYRLTKGLDFNLLYQYQKQNTQTSNVFDTASYFARDEINRYSQINRSTGVVNYIVPLGGIMNKAYSGLSSYNFRGQLNFNRVFNHLHRINAIAGMELRDNKVSSNSAIYYGYNADPLIYANAIDYVTRYPIIYGGRSAIPAASGGLTETENRFLSFFANAAYTYNDKYIASGSLRKDGSNIFGANTNDKWNPLWSAGLGWILSKEKFYHLKWLSFLKLSTTYGVSGNVDLSKSALPVAVATIGFNINLPSENITTLNNPDLRWEKAYQTNLRLDFATVKNIISGSLEYYHKKGTDLYAPTPYDYTAWGIGSTITANAADMKGNGVDISLHSNNIDGAFKWSTNFIFNYNTSITTKYFGHGPATLSQLIGNGGTIITPIVGKPLYAVAAYRWGGLDAQGNPRGYLNDTLSSDYNAIESASQSEGLASGSFKYIGSATPEIYGSLLNSFLYKNFSLSFNITYKIGYYLFKPSLSYYALATNGLDGIDYQKRWQQPGDELKTQVPSFVYPLNSGRDGLYGASEINVIRGDQIRLQFINLAYSFLQNQRKLPFANFQLYFNAANLGILWRANKDHIDPDYPSGAPNPISYTFGIRANF